MGLQPRLLLAVHSHATMLQQRAYLNTSENEEDADDIFSLLLCRLLLLLHLPSPSNRSAAELFAGQCRRGNVFVLHVVIVVVAAAAALCSVAVLGQWLWWWWWCWWIH